MPSSTRQRSLSFGAIPPRSVRPRPASTLPPTANIANSTAAILDALDAGHQAAPDALDDGAGLGTSPQGGTANAGPASPGSYAETQVGSEQSDAEDDAWAEAEHGGIHELHLALLASQRPQVPHLGGGGAHHVCHDAELCER